MRDVLVSMAVGFAIALGAFGVGAANIAMNGPRFIEGAAFMILRPGDAIPLYYWGGVHDAADAALSLVLNGLAYGTVVFSVTSWTRAS